MADEINSITRIVMVKFAQPTYTNQYAHVEVDLLREGEDGCPLGLSVYETDLAELSMSCQVDDKADHAYGFSIFMGGWRIELNDAERIVKALRRVTRAVKKLCPNANYDHEFGAFLKAFCKTTGAAKIFFVDRSKWYEPRYSANDYIIYTDIDEACAYVNDQIKAKLANWQNTNWTPTQP